MSVAVSNVLRAPAELVAGDVLLYRSSNLYGVIINAKTWHHESHVEVFIGNGISIASRDGIGTGKYPLRLDHLEKVCRPIIPFDLATGIAWFDAQPHRPYGWWDLAQFEGIPVDTNGIVCSPEVTEFCRACGYDPFNGEPSKKIAPFEFAISPVFRVFTYSPEVAGV